MTKDQIIASLIAWNIEYPRHQDHITAYNNAPYVLFKRGKIIYTGNKPYDNSDVFQNIYDQVMTCEGIDDE